MWLLLVMIHISSWLIVTANGQYEMKDDIGTWENARNNCLLASPNILFSEGELTIAATVLGDVSLDKGQKAWIGYAKTFDVFRYVGCVTVSNITSNNINHKIVQTALEPGQCAFACKLFAMFGLRLQKTNDDPNCFCFETEISGIYQRRNGCNKRCNDNVFLCGDEKFVSLYQHVDTDVITNAGANEKKCLSYNKEDSSEIYTYKWKGCDDKKYPLCFNGNLFEIHPEEKMKWREAVDRCFHNDAYPMYPMNDLQVQLNLTQHKYWLSHINAETIKDVVDLEESQLTEYGYVENVGDDTYTVRFTDKGDKTSASICQKEITTPTKASESSTTSMISSTSENSSTGVSTTPLQSIDTVTTSAQQQNTSEPSSGALNSEDGNDKVGVYVGIPAAILICISIVVVVIVLYIRRRKGRTETKESAGTSQNIITYTDVNCASSYANMTFDYDELIKMENPEQRIQSAYNRNNTEDTYDLAEEDAQTTCSKNNIEGSYDLAEEDTPTNCSKNNMGETYDFAQAVVQEPQSAENSYFVLEKADGSTSNRDNEPIPGQPHRELNVYNTANHENNLDEYDHLGQTRKPQVLENTHYDMTSNGSTDGSLYGTMSGVSKMNNVADPTYAHTTTNTNYSNIG